MKLKDYVRTKKGIAKIIDRINDPTNYFDKFWVCDRYLGLYDDTEYISEQDIIGEPKEKIIDLLEVGDYVNGMEVTRIGGTRWDKNDLHCYCEHNGNENWKQVMIPAKDIKSIVTKEQFSCMEYKIGE